MQRKAMISAAMAALLVVPIGAAAHAQDAGISVTAPHAVESGRTSSGIPIRTVSADAIVQYNDLDLSTAHGAAALEARVEAAARDTCAWLDDLYPLANRVGPEDCIDEAVDSAMGQVNMAVKLASAS